MRCAACGHSWYVAPQLVLSQPADAAMATFVEGPASQGGLTREQIERQRQAAAPPLSTAARARARQVERQKKERIKQAAIAWGVAGGALALSASLALGMRQDIAKMWPNTASAYAAIGMPVNITGLEFNQISVTKTQDGPTPMIVISGAVKNVSHAPKKSPVLRFSLRDDHGEELTHWMEELGDTPLPAGVSRPFRSSLDNPPPAASDLEATFATPAEIAKEAAQPQAAPLMRVGPLRPEGVEGAVPTPPRPVAQQQSFSQPAQAQVQPAVQPAPIFPDDPLADSAPTSDGLTPHMAPAQPRG